MTTTHADVVRGRTLLAIVLLLSVGCVKRATVSPVGAVAQVQIRVGDAEVGVVTGELIEVREDGLLILSGARSDLMFLSYGRILAIDFGNEVDVDTSVHGLPLARFSRYPFGLDDASLQRLLEAYGQTELAMVP